MSERERFDVHTWLFAFRSAARPSFNASFLAFSPPHPSLLSSACSSMAPLLDLLCTAMLCFLFLLAAADVNDLKRSITVNLTVQAEQVVGQL